MSFEKAAEFITAKGYGDKIHHFEVSSATVELAAKAVGTEPQRIAKSLTFLVNEKAVMIVCAGDAKVSNSKYKAFFGTKAKMLSPEQVDTMIGHGIGGVCPFGINDGVSVYLDESFKRFDTVYPACGDARSAIELSIAELEDSSDYIEWIDVCQIVQRCDVK